MHDVSWYAYVKYLLNITVWCQTELSIPPILPEAVEEALKPFCTFTQVCL